MKTLIYLKGGNVLVMNNLSGLSVFRNALGEFTQVTWSYKNQSERLQKVVLDEIQAIKTEYSFWERLFLNSKEVE